MWQFPAVTGHSGWWRVSLLTGNQRLKTAWPPPRPTGCQTCDLKPPPSPDWASSNGKLLPKPQEESVPGLFKSEPPIWGRQKGVSPICSSCAPAEARRWIFFIFSQGNLESLVGNLEGIFWDFFWPTEQKYRRKFRSIFCKKIRSSKKNILRAKFTLQKCHLNDLFRFQGVFAEKGAHFHGKWGLSAPLPPTRTHPSPPPPPTPPWDFQRGRGAGVGGGGGRGPIYCENEPPFRHGEICGGVLVENASKLRQKFATNFAENFANFTLEIAGAYDLFRFPPFSSDLFQFAFLNCLRVYPDLFRFVRSCSAFFRFVTICFQNKSEQVREIPFCRPLLQVPELSRTILWISSSDKHWMCYSPGLFLAARFLQFLWNLGLSETFSVI